MLGFHHSSVIWIVLWDLCPDTSVVTCRKGLPVGAYSVTVRIGLPHLCFRALLAYMKGSRESKLMGFSKEGISLILGKKWRPRFSDKELGSGQLKCQLSFMKWLSFQLTSVLWHLHLNIHFYASLNQTLKKPLQYMVMFYNLVLHF